MTPRSVPIIAAAAAAFVVTLVLSAWHEGLWERPAESPAAATPPAPQPLPAPQPAVKADPPPVPVPAPSQGGPAAGPDSTAPPRTSERDAAARRRDEARGARAR